MVGDPLGLRVRPVTVHMAVRLPEGRVFHVVEWVEGHRTLCGQYSFGPPAVVARPRDVPPEDRCQHAGCRAHWPAWLRLVVGG